MEVCKLADHLPEKRMKTIAQTLRTYRFELVGAEPGMSIRLNSKRGAAGKTSVMSLIDSISHHFSFRPNSTQRK